MPKRDEIGQNKKIKNKIKKKNKKQKKNKILVLNSVHTRPGQENSKKNSKKIQKIIKPLLGISFNQNRMRKTEKVRKKF